MRINLRRNLSLFFIKIPFFMYHFFNLRILQLSLRFVFLCCCFCLPLSLLSQTTTELSRQSVGLTASDSMLVRQSFQWIPKDNYAYIAIHGDKGGFKILEDSKP